MNSTNTSPLVTIGIPTYNRPKELEKCLNYVLTQTYNNIRVIVSDNCTPGDEVDQLMNRITSEDDRVVYYKQEINKGYSYNFTFVLEKAESEYFMWQADDDWVAPDFVEKIVNKLLQEKDAIAGFCDFKHVDPNGRPRNYYPPHLPFLAEHTLKNRTERIVRYINQFERNGKANIIYSIFKTEVLKKENVLRYIKAHRVGGDYLVNLSFLTFGRMVVVPKVLKSFTGENVKHTIDRNIGKNKVIDLFFIKIFVGKVRHIHNLWSSYLFDHFRVIMNSPLRYSEKLPIYFTITKKIFLFYYDLFTLLFEMKRFDIFKKIKRKEILE